MKTKKRNATDLTTRNNNARKREIADLQLGIDMREQEIAELKARLDNLETAVATAYGQINTHSGQLNILLFEHRSKPKRGRGR
jgi:uncharacterized protein (DUF3084 family)